MDTEYKTLEQFYPYYLSEHSDRICRRFHFVGSSGGLVCLALAVAQLNLWYVPAGIVFGYAMAWIGHFFYEHNKPATFKYPWLSFRSDWLMYRDMVTGKITF